MDWSKSGSRNMHQRPCYFLTIVLALVTITIDLAAKHDADKAMKAGALSAVSAGADKEQLRLEGRLFARQSDRKSAAAMTVFLLAIIAWTGSLLRCEPGLQSIPLVLLISAAALQLLLV